MMVINGLFKEIDTSQCHQTRHFAERNSGFCRWRKIIELHVGFHPLPSGKHTKNYGKSPCSMDKSTINQHVQ